MVCIISDTFETARTVEIAIAKMSASDEDLIVSKSLAGGNTAEKRLIKKRTFYGDSTSDEGMQYEDM